MAKTVFAVGAHPDDIEFRMAGTLILLAQAGYEVHYMNIANGSCGSVEYDAATTARVRRDEARRAASSIGAVFHESLVDDICIFYDKPTLARVASVMREIAPEIVLTHAPVDYMEDHVNAGRLAVTAAFCRNMPNFRVDPPRPPVTGEVTVYHALPHGNRGVFGELVLPDLLVDIASVMERKSAMLAEHRSQKDWLDKSQGMDSYLIAMREMCSEAGRMGGFCEYAEGWRRRNPLGFCAPDADPLSTALGGLARRMPSAPPEDRGT